ncbi:MAG: peptidase, partial [Rhodoferax sp.]|nr:peptidase [Rhodoferax sp.]
YKGQYDDEGRARYLKAIAGLEFGDSPAQGLVRGRNFYHAPLGFALTAPAGWQVVNGSEQLAVVNAARDAAMVLRPVPPAAGKTHAEILRNVFKPTQGNTEAAQINGLGATRFTGLRANSQGQQVAVQATVVSGPGDATYLLQFSGKDAQAMQRAAASLREAEGSFRAMTAQDRAAAKPWAIRTVAYPKGGFAELAKASPLANAQQQLRLINGFYAGGEPKPGQLVKVVEAL